jgi:hypothetical protein
MIKFNKPNNLNGAELINELIAADVKVTGRPLIDGNNDLWLNIPKTSETKAKAIVDAHNGSTESVEPTIEAKLASIGLTIDDIKSILS